MNPEAQADDSNPQVASQPESLQQKHRTRRFEPFTGTFGVFAALGVGIALALLLAAPLVRTADSPPLKGRPSATQAPKLLDEPYLRPAVSPSTSAK